ncbi:MAG: NACHT domain-containing protein [Deinococcus sp.]
MDRPLGSPLPGALAPLYGREHDLSQLLTLLRGGVRLLTLRGPGGIGKTALALHLAQALREPSESPQFDHVQVIDLSAVREPDRVIGLIAASLPDSGLRGEPERRIQDFAAGRRTLLILDNFEQLLPAAPGLGDLLAATTTLRLVVTSRAALRLHDEVEYPVEPLTLAHRVRDAASSAAVQLFVARLQALTPTFALGEANTSQVVRLCEVLEGVPLALELAAMRMLLACRPFEGALP